MGAPRSVRWYRSEDFCGQSRLDDDAGVHHHTRSHTLLMAARSWLIRMRLKVLRATELVEQRKNLGLGDYVKRGVGSSAINSLGRHARDIAIMTR